MNVQISGFGDYIFFIMLAIGAIVQLVAQNKQKEDAKQGGKIKPPAHHPFDDDFFPKPKPTQKSQKGTFAEQFETFWKGEGVPAVVQPKPEKVVQPTSATNKPKLKRKPTQIEDLAAKYAEMQKAETAKMQNEGTSDISNSMGMQHHHQNYVQRTRQKINMRQAVIYSEIINRKY